MAAGDSHKCTKFLGWGGEGEGGEMGGGGVKNILGYDEGGSVKELGMLNKEEHF
jgi:hypothetical protein